MSSTRADGAEWRDIASAPVEGKVDLWAKMWAPAFDEFVYQRFPDCFWLGDDPMTNRKGEWVGIAKGWRPTHWMFAPAGPSPAPSPSEPLSPREKE